MISYGRQSISEEDIEAVIETLKSDFLTQGPRILEFEKNIADYCGANYCVAVSNGTVALQLAVAALKLDKNFEGITSPNTFVASANSILYNGGTPVFADIDKRTFNITPESIKEQITKKTRLIIPIHFAGQPCQMEEIKQIADLKKIMIIEDAAHAIGSNYSNGSKVGNCQYSDMTIFSFHPVKTITSGEGGAITTNSEELYETLLLLRNHGITKNTKLLSKNPGPWYYEMQDLGYNFRLSDIQAALGISQLKKLDQYKSRRRELVQRYHELLSGNDNLILPYEENDDSCFHLFVVQIDFEKTKYNRAESMKQLFEVGVGTQVHYIPVNSQPYYMNTVGVKSGDTPNAELYYSKALSLPLYPSMTDSDQDYVVQVLNEVL